VVIWLDSRFTSTAPSQSRTATALSSQEVSMPRVRSNLGAPPCPLSVSNACKGGDEPLPYKENRRGGVYPRPSCKRVNR